MGTQSRDKHEIDALASLSKVELLAVISSMNQTIVTMKKTITDLEKQIAELKGKNPTDRLDEEYSLRAD